MKEPVTGVLDGHTYTIEMLPGTGEQRRWRDTDTLLARPG